MYYKIWRSEVDRMEDRELRRFRIGGILGRIAVCCFVQFSVGTRPTWPRNGGATSAHAEIYGRMHRGKGILHFSDMIKHANTARQISDLRLDIYRRLDESTAAVRKTCTSEEAAAYQKAIGRVIYPIIFDVLEPLYVEHPALKPPKWQS